MNDVDNGGGCVYARAGSTWETSVSYSLFSKPTVAVKNKVFNKK